MPASRATSRRLMLDRLRLAMSFSVASNSRCRVASLRSARLGDSATTARYARTRALSRGSNSVTLVAQYCVSQVSELTPQRAVRTLDGVHAFTEIEHGHRGSESRGGTDDRPAPWPPTPAVSDSAPLAGHRPRRRGRGADHPARRRPLPRTGQPDAHRPRVAR